MSPGLRSVEALEPRGVRVPPHVHADVPPGEGVVPDDLRLRAPAERLVRSRARGGRVERRGDSLASARAAGMSDRISQLTPADRASLEARRA